MKSEAQIRDAKKTIEEASQYFDLDGTDEAAAQGVVEALRWVLDDRPVSEGHLDAQLANIRKMMGTAKN